MGASGPVVGGFAFLGSPGLGPLPYPDFGIHDENLDDDAHVERELIARVRAAQAAQEDLPDSPK